MGFGDQSLGSNPSSASSSLSHGFFVSKDGMRTATVSGCREGHGKSLDVWSQTWPRRDTNTKAKLPSFLSSPLKGSLKSQASEEKRCGPYAFYAA